MFSPVDALFGVTKWYGFLPNHCYLRDTKPGQTFMELPEETRQVLRNLKSDDLARLRWDAVEPLVMVCQFQAEWAREHRRRDVRL